ncbi:MAG TPA: hypothetical protein V6C97_19330 [Oculatellaceae cyanobacterium]
MFKIKTPHGNAGRHFVRMCGAFIASGFVALLCMQSVHISAALIGYAAFTPTIGFVGGLLLTIVLRQVFSLVQTGRFLQYACFWLGVYGAALAGRVLFSGVLQANSALFAFVTFALAFAVMTATGEVPWKGRTWLPVRRVLRKP